MSDKNRPLQRSKLPQPAHRRRRINQVRESLGLRPTPVRRSLRWSRVLLVFSFLLLLGVGALWASQLFNNNQEGGTIIKGGNQPRRKSIRQVFSNKDNVVFLLAGIDGEPPGRSDTIILVNFDTNTYQTRMLSLPRDTWVDIADEEGEKDKLTHSYARGVVKQNKELLELKKDNPELTSDTATTPDNGIKFLMNTIELMFDHQITIDYYIEVKFEGFERIVDSLGGCDINVEKRLKYSDRSQNLKIDLQPGLQHLDGKNTLCYARFRHDAIGDLGRMERQQRVLSALSKQLKNPANFASWFRIIEIIQENTKTDLEGNHLKAIGSLAGKYDATSMLKAFTMDSTSDRALHNTMSVQKVNDEQKQQAIDFLLNLSPDSTIPQTGTHGFIAKELGEYELLHPELKDEASSEERYGNAKNEQSTSKEQLDEGQSSKSQPTSHLSNRSRHVAKVNSIVNPSRKHAANGHNSRKHGSYITSNSSRTKYKSSYKDIKKTPSTTSTAGKIPSHPPIEQGESVPIKSKVEGQ